jgi:hypothetical protein
MGQVLYQELSSAAQPLTDIIVHKNDHLILITFVILTYTLLNDHLVISENTHRRSPAKTGNKYLELFCDGKLKTVLGE